MPSDHAIEALREICAIAPACSETSQELDLNDPHEKACPWRARLRDAQRTARMALHRLGVSECGD